MLRDAEFEQIAAFRKRGLTNLLGYNGFGEVGPAKRRQRARGGEGEYSRAGRIGRLSLHQRERDPLRRRDDVGRDEGATAGSR